MPSRASELYSTGGGSQPFRSATRMPTPPSRQMINTRKLSRWLVINPPASTTTRYPIKIGAETPPAVTAPNVMASHITKTSRELATCKRWTRRSATTPRLVKVNVTARTIARGSRFGATSAADKMKRMLIITMPTAARWVIRATIFDSLSANSGSLRNLCSAVRIL